jgi:hypothetical protein
MPFRLTGMQQTKTNLLRLPDVIQERIARVLVEAATDILKTAQARTPRLTGALMRSGTVHPPVRRGGSIEVAITFGNDQVHYALRQHEDLDLVHTPPGEAKFLETAMIESVPTLGPRIAYELRRQLGITTTVTARYQKS